nr:tigger transposable element-derived protein 6-like [Dermacentor andersoni]
MTSGIFRGWLQKLDRHFMSKDRKIIMVVESCSAHNCTVKLKNIKVVFLLPNTTCDLRPMHQGIIHHVMSKYRKHLLQGIILCSEVVKLHEVGLLSAVHIIAHMWKNTPPQVITNCFRHSGFVRPEHAAVAEELPVKSTNHDSPTFDAVLPTDVTLRDYITIDDCVATTGLLTNEEIINDATGAREDHDSDEESCEEVQTHRTLREVTEALLILEEVCRSPSDSLQAVGHLEELRKIVMSAGIGAKKQTTIAKYFSK